MIRDILNAAFELSGFVFVALNCIDIWRKKYVAGQTLTAVLFFAAWGFWNLYYYPSMKQWWSTAGAIGVMAANAVLIALVLRYRNAVVAVAVDETYTGPVSSAPPKKRYPIKRKRVKLGKSAAEAVEAIEEGMRDFAARHDVFLPFNPDMLYEVGPVSADVDRVLAGEKLSEGRTEINHRFERDQGVIVHELSWEDKPGAKKGKKK